MYLWIKDLPCYEFLRIFSMLIILIFKTSFSRLVARCKVQDKKTGCKLQVTGWKFLNTECEMQDKKTGCKLQGASLKYKIKRNLRVTGFEFRVFKYKIRNIMFRMWT